MVSTDLKKSYLDWINQKLDFKDLNEGTIEITTPFLDRHNDRLQIYAIPTKEDTIKLSDDGFIISDLTMSGVDINISKKRKQMFSMILKGYGVSYNPKHNELYVIAEAKDFPQRKHMLIQAMISVNDMFMTSKQNVSSFFTEDVSHFLESNDIRYTENIFLAGSSGYNHNFHFLIPHFKQTPERVIHTMNSPSKGILSNIVFSWRDTQEERRKRSYESELYVFINDQDKNVDKNILSAFENEAIRPVLWSKRYKVTDILSA